MKIDIIEILFLKELYLVILIGLILLNIIAFDVYVNKFKKDSIAKYSLMIIIAIICSFLFGYRDIKIGTDTSNYTNIFENIFVPMKEFVFRKDFLWDSSLFLLSRFTDKVNFLFLFVAVGYIFLPILGIQKLLKHNTIYFFFFFLVSPNLFLQGANTIRNGLAASIFLFSFRYYNSKRQWFILILSVLVHLSMIAPFLFYIISKYFKNYKVLCLVWFIMLLFSALGINFFTLLPINLNRLTYYLDGGDGTVTNRIFNIPANFLIYSIFPIIIATYFILIRKKFDDLYVRLSIVYVLSSCIYIAAFHIKFVERFAYISEFLMPLVAIYPFFKFKVIKYGEICIALFLIFIFLIKSNKIFMY